MEDLSGRQFGPYRIVSALGEGGMATVFKGYQPGVDRYVALKVLPRHLMSEQQFASRFKQEAQLLAGLQHPHILPVFDFGQSDGYSYIVMPFLESGTLANRLQGQPLPQAEIVRIISQLGDALDYAHSQGVIHRDIKPSNVLLDRRGNCLLSDFGIAKLYESTSRLTATGGIIGTPAYMSPEQGEGKPVDHRSDIYSLGVVLYEMATGRVPFHAETPIATVLKHIQEPLPLPRAVNPSVSEAIERVILRALAKRPEDRFATAGAMIQAIQGGVDADAGTVIERPAAPSARRVWPIFAVGLLLVALGLGAVWGVRELSNRSRSGLDATAEGRTTGIEPSGENGIDAVDRSTTTPGAAAELLPTVPTVVATEAPQPTATVAAVATASSTPEATLTATAAPVAVAGEVRVNGADGASIIYIPDGAVTLGLNDSQVGTLLGICTECEENHFSGSQPVHQVQVDAYWIYRTEVSNGMYELCVQAGQCTAPAQSSSNTRSVYWGVDQYRDFPVIHVSWFAARDYCDWAGGRLPTNAEWERAARGDSTRLFPWGDALPDLHLANIGQEDGDTRAVGSYPEGASPYGVLDMAGNVWEWVADWFEFSYYRDSTLQDPQGPAQSSEGARVGRGGSWFWNGAYASAGYRDWWEPENEGAGVGFRCVVEGDS